MLAWCWLGTRWHDFASGEISGTADDGIDFEAKDLLLVVSEEVRQGSVLRALGRLPKFQDLLPVFVDCSEFLNDRSDVGGELG